MFATRIGKLLHSNRVTHISHVDDITIWFVDRIMSPIKPGAMTAGNLILSTGDFLDPNVLRHELEHVDQWRRYGSVGFALRYGAQFVWELVKLAAKFDFRNITFYAYYNMPLEREARDAEHTE